VIQRSNDGGQTWEAVGNKFAYEGRARYTPMVRWHAAPLGVQTCLATATVADRPGNGLCRRGRCRPVPLDGRGTKLAGTARAARRQGPSLAARRGRDVPAHDPVRSKQSQPIFVAISAAGAFRTDDGGQTWRPINQGLVSPGELPDKTAEVGHCVHNLAMHPARPGILFMQKHWDVMRSDNAGDSWHEVSGNLPSDFGFPIAVHAHEPNTVYVIPIKSDSEHYPPDGKLRVYRSRSGGDEWEALTNGLPQKDCYVNVLRSALAVDTLDSVRHLFRHHRRTGVCLDRFG
jgi:hypothetical protein